VVGRPEIDYHRLRHERQNTLLRPFPGIDVMSTSTGGNAHLEIANRFVEQANAMIEAGDDAEAVGLAMTHAAANFTAFAAVLAEGSHEELDNVADEYRRLLHAYFDSRRQA